MHTIEKKRDDPCHNSGYPIPVQGTQEIAFKRVQFYKFPGGGHAPGFPPSPGVRSAGQLARTVHVRQLNHCIRYFQMLPKTLVG